MDITQLEKLSTDLKKQATAIDEFVISLKGDISDIKTPEEPDSISTDQTQLCDTSETDYSSRCRFFSFKLLI